MKKQLTKSNDKKIAGVLAGLADYFELDATLVRVGYVLLSVFSAGFPGILAYIVMMIVMPKAALHGNEYEEVVEIN